MAEIKAQLDDHATCSKEYKGKAKKLKEKEDKLAKTALCLAAYDPHGHGGTSINGHLMGR